MLSVGFVLYATNCIVGIVAHLFRIGFGVLHHVLYAVVFGSAILAAIDTRHPALVLTLASLAALPRARPRTIWHPLLAAIGFVGYILAVMV